MSRPSAGQRAQADAQHMKALATYAELTLLTEMLDNVTAREWTRFGSNPIAAELEQLGRDLGRVRLASETRARS